MKKIFKSYRVDSYGNEVKITVFYKICFGKYIQIPAREVIYSDRIYFLSSELYDLVQRVLTINNIKLP